MNVKIGAARAGGIVVLTADEYRKHAEDYRRLAEHMVAPEDRRALEELAENWERLAKLHDRDLVPQNE